MRFKHDIGSSCQKTSVMSLGRRLGYHRQGLVLNKKLIDTYCFQTLYPESIKAFLSSGLVAVPWKQNSCQKNLSTDQCFVTCTINASSSRKTGPWKFHAQSRTLGKKTASVAASDLGQVPFSRFLHLLKDHRTSSNSRGITSQLYVRG